MLNIQHSVDLRPLNTLRLSSLAANYLILDNLDQLSEITQQLERQPNFFVLGGGSNIVLPQSYPGLVIHNQLKGIVFNDYDADYCLVSAQAGENWDNFVATTLTQQAYGLENLSLIPGSVGASPVQNIGAYGVEVKDFIHQVEVYDFQDRSRQVLAKAECQFSYRNSRFKNNPRYLVLSVTFKLLKQAKLNISYGDIARQIAPLSKPTAADLRQCIIATRQSKLPDPRLIGNAGSFFHNPIIAKAAAQQLTATYPNLPQFATSDPDKIKISAGWLIDNLGLKGYRNGNLGVYLKQALVLVNHDTATQEELLEFAKLIQDKVFNSYQIKLNIEPIILC